MLCRAKLFCLVVLSFATPVVAIGCGGGIENHAPILLDQQAVTDEDVAIDLKVLDGASDPDANALTVTGATAPGHGVEVIGGTVVRLTPMRDFHGTIELSFDVSDGTLQSTGRVMVTVRPVNDPPMAAGGSRNIHGSDKVMLEASDVDGDALTYAVIAGPSHGVITGDPPALQYTPAQGFIGDDSIIYQASDGVATSQPGALLLHVSPGAAPVAIAGSATGDEDHQIDVILHASDPDGDALAFAVVTPPAHGTIDGTPPNLVYTPAADFNGDDALAFSVSDGFLSSGTATVAIHVAPVNDAPVATPQAVTAVEDTSVDITLAGSDVEGAALTFQVVNAPSHGTLSILTGAALTYTPALNYHGPDSFTFVDSDGTLGSSPATVTLEVASVGDPPVAMSFAHTLAEDTPNAVTLVGSDVDGDALSYAIVTPPAHGALDGTPPNLTYTPAADFNGDDSFSYTVSDGTATSEPGTVTLHVTPVNDAPVAVDGTATTDEDTAVDLTLQASDVDGQALSYTIITPPADGTLSGTGAIRRYTPARNANGTRTLTFRVADGTLTASATVTITIQPVNDPPTATDDFAGTDPDSALSFDVVGNDHDIDGDTLALAAVDAPAHGTAEIVDGKLVYTPSGGFTGIDVFGYTVTDGNGGSAHGTVHLGVGGFPPGAPTELIATVGVVSTTNPDHTPAVSSDGRYIAFATAVALVADDTHNGTDVYLYDRSTRTFALVSVDSAGHPGNGVSVRPQLSSNGRYIVFESSATNLVSGDTNGIVDVFRHDRVTGETVRVSVASDGTQGNGASLDAAISGDGNLVAFTSSAFNLVANDANGASDIFVRDLAAGTTQRISVSVSGGDSDLASTEPVISSDGKLVAFTSLGTNLVAFDSNNQRDIFLRDLVAGTTARVSVSTVGGQANGPSNSASMSRDARFIAFASSATNLVPGGSSGYYVRDQQAQTTTLPLNVVFTRGAQLSGDGRFVASFDSFFPATVISDRFSGNGATLPVALFWPSISDNVRYVVGVDPSGRLGVTPNPLAP